MGRRREEGQEGQGQALTRFYAADTIISAQRLMMLMWTSTLMLSSRFDLAGLGWAGLHNGVCLPLPSPLASAVSQTNPPCSFSLIWKRERYLYRLLLLREIAHAG